MEFCIYVCVQIIVICFSKKQANIIVNDNAK